MYFGFEPSTEYTSETPAVSVSKETKLSYAFIHPSGWFPNENVSHTTTRNENLFLNYDIPRRILHLNTS